MVKIFSELTHLNESAEVKFMGTSRQEKLDLWSVKCEGPDVINQLPVLPCQQYAVRKQIALGTQKGQEIQLLCDF